jgi:hypothetical protein
VGLKSLKSLNLTNGYPNKNKKNKKNNNNKVKSKPLELFELAGKNSSPVTFNLTTFPQFWKLLFTTGSLYFFLAPVLYLVALCLYNDDFYVPSNRSINWALKGATDCVGYRYRDAAALFIAKEATFVSFYVWLKNANGMAHFLPTSSI